MATVTNAVAGAARRAPLFAPRGTPSSRPELRVVDAAVRQRRRRIGYGVAAGLAVALFAIVGSQTLIVAQQGHIDSVNRQIADAQARAVELRVKLAELQSPQYITTAASTRLGMIPAPTPVYLQPRATDDQRAAELPATTPPTTAWKAKSTTPTTAAPKATIR